MISAGLKHQVIRLAETVDAEALLQFTQRLRTLRGVPTLDETYRLTSAFSPAAYRLHLHDLVNTWRTDCPSACASIVADLIEVAVAVRKNQGALSHTEVVWTGPAVDGLSLRRTEQVLFEIIKKARHEIWLASYAFFSFGGLTEALTSSAEKGVKVNCVLETSDGTQGRINHLQAVKSLSRIPGINLYHWPLEYRSRETGRSISMHVKAVIADEKHALVTSANLTDAAMAFNMELGLYVQGGHIPDGITDLWRKLLATGKLQRLV